MIKKDFSNHFDKRWIVVRRLLVSQEIQKRCRNIGQTFFFEVGHPVFSLVLWIIDDEGNGIQGMCGLDGFLPFLSIVNISSALP